MSSKAPTKLKLPVYKEELHLLGQFIPERDAVKMNNNNEIPMSLISPFKCPVLEKIHYHVIDDIIYVYVNPTALLEIQLIFCD